MRFTAPPFRDAATKVETDRVAAAILASCLVVAAWVALAALLNHSQLIDSLEQFVWGRGLEWGYWKHPPLTSWLMWVGLELAGPTPLVTYVLAALLTMVTIACTTRFAQVLAGDEVAIYTALLLVLHYGLTRRAQVYNHNTVLLACGAALALASLLAVRSNRAGAWMVAGIAAGLALLAKYQAAVVIVGVLLAIVLSGQLRRCLPGLALATVCAVVVFLPHAVWALQHDLQTLHYAASSLGASDAQHGQGHRAISVVAMQLKYFLPAIAFVLLLRFALRGPVPGEGRPAPAWSAEQRSWVAGLVLVPALVLAIAVAAGVRVQSHWGLEATQFLPLALALLLHRRFGTWRRPQAGAWLLVQVFALGLYVAQTAGALPGNARARNVRDVDASEVARQVLAHWHAQTSCRLRYLSGSVDAAGMVAAYARQDLRVLEDGDVRKSPWIDMADMHDRGFVGLRLQATSDHGSGEVVVPLDRSDEHSGPQFLVLDLNLPAAPC